MDDFFDRGILMSWYTKINGTPEDVVDWRGNIPTDGWGMDANGPDQTAPAVISATGIGDCGPTGMDHWQMAINAAQGRPWASWGSPAVVSLYSELGGYVLGDPTTDNGTNLQSNLEFWRKNVIHGIQLTGFGAIRPGTWDRAVRVATMRMFGPLYTGVNLQNAQETQFPGPWVYVPGGAVAGGHCIDQVAELSQTDECIDLSWGAAVSANTNFQYVAAEEMWALLTDESVDAAGSNPYGYNIAQMNEAIASMTGETNPLGLRKIL
jgi:ABC-type glycerol-3-phosphate transport system substrate-binding protein